MSEYWAYLKPLRGPRDGRLVAIPDSSRTGPRCDARIGFPWEFRQVGPSSPRG